MKHLQAIKTPVWQGETADQVLKIALHHQCDAVVVGMPLSEVGKIYRQHEDSREGRICRNFAVTLAVVAQKHRLKVFLVNERDTTKEAAARLRLSGHNDSFVAVRPLRWCCTSTMLKVRLHAKQALQHCAWVSFRSLSALS
jgi:RNase H-fold protein (predicted Holliday junction resolvase)